LSLHKESSSRMAFAPMLVRLTEIVAKVNDLFDGDPTDGDEMVYVNHVLEGSAQGNHRHLSQSRPRHRPHAPTKPA